MKLSIFAIYDDKAKSYMRPFFMPETGQAIRTVTDLANDKTHDIGRHPADYTLFKLGIYNEEDATFDLLPSGQNLANCLTLVHTNVIPIQVGAENETE